MKHLMSSNLWKKDELSIQLEELGINDILALTLRSSGLILFHNHPSGDPTPGIEDIKQTEKLKDASDLLNITLIDHIIVGDQSYFSFAENKETCK